MAFKDLLLTLATYPEPTPVAAVHRAISFAKLIEARLSAMACEVHIEVPGRFEFLANALIDVPALAAAEMQRSAKNARDLLAAFKERAQAEGVFGETLSQRCVPALVPDAFVTEARLRDLTIVPVPEGDHIDQWYAESVMFGSGHPTLVFSESKDGPLPAIDRIAVAWDGSRPAARAIWDALPLLQKARDVRVLQVPEGRKADHASAERLVSHLTGHGVPARAHTEQPAGRDIAKVIRSYLENEAIELVVMGAYGHSKLREFVLGGVTKSMLAHPPAPMLLSH